MPIEIFFQYDLFTVEVKFPDERLGSSISYNLADVGRQLTMSAHAQTQVLCNHKASYPHHLVRKLNTSIFRQACW